MYVRELTLPAGAIKLGVEVLTETDSLITDGVGIETRGTSQTHTGNGTIWERWFNELRLTKHILIHWRQIN